MLYRPYMGDFKFRFLLPDVISSFVSCCLMLSGCYVSPVVFVLQKDLILRPFCLFVLAECIREKQNPPKITSNLPYGLSRSFEALPRLEIFKSSNLRTFKSSNLRTFKSSNLRTFKSSNLRILRDWSR